MDNIIEKKSNAIDSINGLLSALCNFEVYDNGIIYELNKKNDILNKANMKLIDEINAKDKIISTDKKTICDYEKQINSLNEVKEEDNKFGMLKAKDKEVNNLNKTVESLKKELELVNSKLEMVTTTTNVTCEVVDNPVKGSVEGPVDEENDTESDEEIGNATVTHKKVKYLLNSNKETVDKDLKECVKKVSDKLHHTPEVCKKNYLLPELIEFYLKDNTKFTKFFRTNINKQFTKFLKNNY